MHEAGYEWDEEKKEVKKIETQGEKKSDCHQNYEDINQPKGYILMRDFDSSKGFYKLHINYLKKEQLEELKEKIRTWNKEIRLEKIKQRNTITEENYE